MAKRNNEHPAAKKPGPIASGKTRVQLFIMPQFIEHVKQSGGSDYVAALIYADMKRKGKIK